MKTLFFVLISFLCIACTQKKETSSIQNKSTDSLAMHYWDDFDFANSNSEATESAFPDYLQMLSHCNPAAAEKSISALLNKAEENSPAAFDTITCLFEKYLYNPNSPIRNEELYIPVLRYICLSQSADFASKSRAAFRLNMTLKNRVGTIAADFEYVLRNGEKHKLSDVQAEYTVLFFNNPDCHDCARVKAVLSSIVHPQIKIVAIYPDENVTSWEKTTYPETWINGQSHETIHQLYDLKAIPTLYLLDKNKRVILKDAPVKRIWEVVN